MNKNKNSESKPSQDFNAEIRRDNKGQIINQNKGTVIQTQNNYIIRFFKLLSEQALKGSIVGAVIGLSLMFISHTIFYPIVKTFYLIVKGYTVKEVYAYTVSARCAEFICAIFVGLYCRLFCSNHLSRNSQKNFLAALTFVVTWFVLPSVRQIFLTIFATFDSNTADTISYPMSYAIICVLAGGVIETIAEMLDNSKKK